MIKMSDGTTIKMKEIKDAISPFLERHIYIQKRYGVEISIVFVHTSTDVNYLSDRIIKAVRKSDEVIRLHNELFVIFYRYVSYSGAYKATQKLIHKLSQFHKPVHASILEVHQNETAHSLMQKSMYLLNEVKDNKESSLEDIVSYQQAHPKGQGL